MCDPISGMILAGSIAATFGSAYMQSANAKAEAQIEQSQLKVEIENERIKALGDTNDRLEQFRKDEAANRAAMSVNGLGRNFSYTGGILPGNREIVRRDVRNITYNAGQEVGRKKYEIAVAGWKAKSTSRSAYMQAFGDSIGKIGSAYTDNTSANSVYPNR